MTDKSREFIDELMEGNRSLISLNLKDNFFEDSHFIIRTTMKLIQNILSTK